MVGSPYPPPATMTGHVLFYSGDEVEFSMRDGVVGTGIVRWGSNAGFRGLEYTVREDGTGDDHHGIPCNRISLIARPAGSVSAFGRGGGQNGWNPATGGRDH